MKNGVNIWSATSARLWLIGIDLIFMLVVVSVMFLRPEFLETIKWEYPKVFFLFLISPAITLIYLINLGWKKRALSKWHNVNFDELKSLSGDSFSTIKVENSIIRIVLVKLSIVFFILAAAGPNYGEEFKELTTEGVELMIALDLSKSMLAEDIQPNRLYVAKKAIKNTVNKLGGDLTGLVVFAASSFTQMPLSNDYASALSYLETVNTSTVPTQGTSLASAIDECVAGFKDESESSRIILLITDGEDHEEDIEASIEAAVEKGIKISCVAIGSENGAPIPDYSADSKYKKDAQGNTVISAVNELLLKQIATQGKGQFFRISSSKPSEINSIVNYIVSEQSANTGNFTVSELKPKFRIPLLFGLIFLLLSFLIKEKKATWI